MQFPKPVTIKLKGKEYTEFRKQVADRAKERCEGCGCYAPRVIDGTFDQYRCGHVSHKKSKGAGGHDTLENVEWLCWKCHRTYEDKWNYH